MDLRIFDSAADLAAAAADLVASTARRAVEARTRCTLALSGGSTPRALYGRLAAPPVRDELWWEGVEVFWGDERAVGPDHPDSNYRMARETLLEPLGLEPARVHRMRGEAEELWQAAAEYERELREAVADSAAGMPVFDLVLLGLGSDGHTASLFPGTIALRENDRAVVASEAPGIGGRLTLTFPALVEARALVVLVAGGSKAEALQAVLHGPFDPDRWPAQRLREAGDRVTWMVDRAAARRLSETGPL